MILGRLRQAPVTVGELTEAVQMEQSAVSYQLQLLRTLGLIAARRIGRSIIYSRSDRHVATLLAEAVCHAAYLRAVTARAATEMPGATTADDGQPGFSVR